MPGPCLFHVAGGRSKPFRLARRRKSRVNRLLPKLPLKILGVKSLLRAQRRAKFHRLPIRLSCDPRLRPVFPVPRSPRDPRLLSSIANLNESLWRAQKPTRFLPKPPRGTQPLYTSATVEV